MIITPLLGSYRIIWSLLVWKFIKRQTRRSKQRSQSLTSVSSCDLLCVPQIPPVCRGTQNQMTEYQNQSRYQSQQTKVQWRWYGGGWESQTRHGRRTKCQLDSPHTLRLCWRALEGRRRSAGGGPLLCGCARWNTLQKSSTDSRTDRSFQTYKWNCSLSFWLLHMRQLRERLLSTPPPSNNAQLDQQHRAAGRSTQICVDCLDIVGSLWLWSRSSCPLTLSAFCTLCLDPASVHRQLKGTRTTRTQCDYFSPSLFEDDNKHNGTIRKLKDMWRMHWSFFNIW